MDNQVKIVNIRMPKGLVDRIDECISADRLHATRPDFLIDSIRGLFTMILDTRIMDDDEDVGAVATALRMFHVRLIIEESLEEYRGYQGDPVQIVIRFPIGLFKTINEYSDKLKPYTSFMSLLRASSVYGLHNVRDWLNQVDPDTYEVDPLFDYGKLDMNIARLFQEYDNATELYRFMKEKLKN